MSKSFWLIRILSSLFFSVVGLGFVLSFLELCFACSAWLKLVLPFRNWVLHFIVDHAQSREFHHHLARAIMHLNCLAGILPFFEPAIEWDEWDSHTRVGRSNPAQRNLHTFVPLPSSSSAPTMASHGGIPTHMILNPEPNLRPLSIASRPCNDEVHPATLPTLRHPHNDTRHPLPPAPHSTVPDSSQATTRTSTTAVPVRSKQRSNNPEDPHPKKKQRSGHTSIHSPPIPAISLPTITEVPLDGLN